MPLNLNTNVYHRRTQLINHALYIHVWTPLDSLEALQSVLEDL